MKLILHIGYGKTGTSAIQSYLALNSSLLKDYGINYPSHRSMNNAMKGKVSSGNLGGIDDWQSEILKTADSNLINLYSGERLFNKLVGGESIDRLLSAFSSVKVLLFIRDPFDHVSSSWLQSVKRAGCTKSFEEYALTDYSLTQKLLAFLQKYSDSNIELCIKNYSRDKANTINNFMTMCLPVEVDSFCEQAETIKRPVNRSLTSTESHLQMAFNKHYGANSSIFVSVPLVNELRDINIGSPSLSEEVCRTFQEKSRKTVDSINTFLEAEDKLELEYDDYIDTEPKADALALSRAQIDVFAKSISKQMLQTVSKKELKLISDIALKHNTKELVSESESMMLLELVQRCLPKDKAANENVEALKLQSLQFAV